MSLKDDFSEFMANTISIKTKSGTNLVGENTFTTISNIDCCVAHKIVEFKIKNDKTTISESVISDCQFYIDGNMNLNIGYIIIYNNDYFIIKQFKYTQELGKPYSTIIYT